MMFRIGTFKALPMPFESTYMTFHGFHTFGFMTIQVETHWCLDRFR